MQAPSLSIHQNGMFFSWQNGFIRQADSKPLITKCMGTSMPTLKRSMNCRAPSVYPLPIRPSMGNITRSNVSVILRMSFSSPKKRFSSYKGLIRPNSSLSIHSGTGSSARNREYQLQRSPAWNIRFPSTSTIQLTPLSLLPVAKTVMFPSFHTAPRAIHTSASSFCALRCFNMSLDNM